MVRSLSALALSCVVLLPLAAPLEAQGRRVYAGAETQALKCAWIISRTSALLEGAGLISTRDMEVAFVVSARILALHVSGTEKQKLKALEAVGQRRDIEQTVKEFRTQTRACLRKFPVQ